MPSQLSWRRWIPCIMAAYFAVMGLFYVIAHDQLYYKSLTTESVSASAIIAPEGEWTAVQALETDDKTEITALAFRASSSAEAVVTVSLVINGVERASRAYAPAALSKEGLTPWRLEEPISLAAGDKAALHIVPEGEGVSLYCGALYDYGRVSIDAAGVDRLLINQESATTVLCHTVSTRNPLWVGRFFWPFALALGALLLAECLRTRYLSKRGRKNMFLQLYAVITDYRFLIEQLISRDFKTKYKKSALGFLWSFLNPLLTMCVQYLVFSTIFKSSVAKFPVYLLSGIVLFNFFSESINLGLRSILDNRNLICKVRMPKYIFPVSKVVFSAINLLIAMVPLLLAMLISGLRLNWAMLLLPYGLICLTLFCIGMVLLLSASMVFFHDTQFLWNILSMIWMYLTPIFYPASIIPARFQAIYRLNPLYQFITFTRTIILDGISPTPGAYLACAVCALVPLIAGVLVFRRFEDEFVLHI